MADRAYLERLSRELADRGKLVEAGWVSLRLMIAPSAPAQQLDDMRLAYFAGAEHLFASLITMLEPGATESDADLSRMDSIHKELRAWRDEVNLRASKAKGSA